MVHTTSSLLVYSEKIPRKIRGMSWGFGVIGLGLRVKCIFNDVVEAEPGRIYGLESRLNVRAIYNATERLCYFLTHLLHPNKKRLQPQHRGIQQTITGQIQSI